MVRSAKPKDRAQVLCRTPEHQPENENPEHGEELAILFAEIVEAVLAEVVVVHDRAEGEHHQRDTDKAAAPGTEMLGQRVLGQGDTRDGRVPGLIDIREQDDQRRAAAHHQRIDEYAEGLHDALVGRVRHIGNGGDVGRAAQSRLVAEQTALDALHDRDADTTTEGGIEPESTGHDLHEDPGHLVIGSDRSRAAPRQNSSPPSRVRQSRRPRRYAECRQRSRNPGRQPVPAR
jgi:hypothetical protein